MPRRKVTAEVENHRPLISFERIVYEKASFKVSKGLLTSLNQYVAYIKEASGDEPTPDEVIDKGMQRLFDADRGFKQWLQKNGANGGTDHRAEPVNGAVKSAAAGIVTEKPPA